MSGVTSGPHGWMMRRFYEWRTQHGYQPGMVWNPWAGADKAVKGRCPYCRRAVHGAYEWPK